MKISCVLIAADERVLGTTCSLVRGRAWIRASRGSAGVAWVEVAMQLALDDVSRHHVRHDDVVLLAM